jgi:ribosomal protein S18
MKVGISKTEMRLRDPLHHLQINPIHEVLNVPLLSQFVSRTGKILRRSETNLSSKNHRLVGKAIKRSRYLGFMPAYGRRAGSGDGTVW